mgnify:CR=1 FL=1
MDTYFALERLHDRIQGALERSGRTDSIKVVAASKYGDANMIAKLFDAGQHSMGENRIQDAIPKIEHLKGKSIDWHFIGHLQSNKVKKAVQYFDCIQSIDSLGLLRVVDLEKNLARWV